MPEPGWFPDEQNDAEGFVWYGLRGFALMSDRGGGGLLSRGLDTREVRYRRSSASAMYGTPEGDRITVTSHALREAGALNQLGDLAVVNILNWVPIEQRRGITRRRDDNGAVEVAGVTWEPGEIAVEGRTAPLEVCQFDNGFWVAVGRTADAGIAIESRGLPLEGLELVRMAYPPPDPSWSS